MEDKKTDHVPDSELSDHPVEHPKKRKGGRRKTCGCCLGLFVILCGLAALGNWMLKQGQRAGLPVPVMPTPILSDTWPTPPPRIEQTPHVLPKDLNGVKRVLVPVMKERFADTAAGVGVKWPPARVRLVGLKIERTLEVWIANADGPYHLLKSYPVLAASGDIGPKRRQGDKQVPEGHYRFVYLNPDSEYHLSLLLDYPNAADKARERKVVKDGVNLGSSICVHGSNMSIGCLAMGDAAIEEIFTLVSLARSGSRDILIMPADFRKRPDLVSLAGDDKQILELYMMLASLAATVTRQ